ncbi:MCE family protein [Planosporangium thailandense]|uniref:MCE family protein n=1 Tax=Planosporangium thailandense TaxID=765197 RepID=A0ABX0YA25_9ACTN|nr:MCE family protein [Planosporangium thailandense]NJC74232.1 MCE family protein [Planosporangium thailandense]
MNRRLARTGPLTVAGALAVALTAGCTPPSLADLPLPGSAPSGAAYHVTAEFSDVLDLVPQSAVKVNDVTVGSVEKISLSGWTARVRMKIDKKVHLPDNATASVRQTSLLGEKFVELAPPTAGKPVGTLSDGDVIPLARTQRSAEVEEVLGALGLILNGGGLAQLKTINEELAKALDGRESNARDALSQLNTFVSGLDAQKEDIVRAIDALDRLTAQLSAQRATIGTAVDSLAPGLTVLNQQRADLTNALTALGQLGQVGTRVINASRDNTIADLKSLQPILDQLVQAGNDLPKSLDFMLSYPFPPNADSAVSGDAMNLHATLDLSAADILSNLVAATGPVPTYQAKPSPSNIKPTAPKVPTPTPATPPVPGVLPQVCIPAGAVLPGLDKLPASCKLPAECTSLPPGSPIPTGGYVPPDGLVPAGTVLPQGTRLVPGTILTPGCLLPDQTGTTPTLPSLTGATGEIVGQLGGLGNVLGGGLHP